MKWANIWRVPRFISGLENKLREANQRITLLRKERSFHRNQRIIKNGTFLQHLRDWLVAPSPEITKPDERRQAGLLSGLLLMLMVAGALVEVLTTALINEPHYNGYWDTIAAICVMAVIYAISRTRYIRLASLLTVF